MVSGLKLALLVSAIATITLSTISLLIVPYWQSVGQPKEEITTTQPKQEVITTTPSTEKPLKVHIHELYMEYEKNPNATLGKWMGKQVVTVGRFWGTRGENELLIYSFPYVITPIEVFASCPVKDKSIVDKVRYSERFVAVSGKIVKIGMFEVKIGGLPTQYTKVFELGLQDCTLLNLSEVKEFKAQFFKENWTLVIQNYAYNLEVKLRKANEPLGYGAPLISLNPLQREAKWNLFEATSKGGWFYPPGDYVLEVLEGGERVLANWTFKVLGLQTILETLRFEITDVKGQWLSESQYRLDMIQVKFYNAGPVPTMVYILRPKSIVYRAEGGQEVVYHNLRLVVFNTTEETGVYILEPELVVLAASTERTRCLLNIPQDEIHFKLIQGVEEKLGLYASCGSISTNVEGEKVEIVLMVKDGAGNILELARIYYNIPPKG
jgi:hypothetical protein